MTADYDARRADMQRRGKELEHEYMRILHDIGSGLREMKEHHQQHGQYPMHTKGLMQRLRREGLTIKVEILRLHADMIELNLLNENDIRGLDVPNNLPDGPPETW